MNEDVEEDEIEAEVALVNDNQGIVDDPITIEGSGVLSLDMADHHIDEKEIIDVSDAIDAMAIPEDSKQAPPDETEMRVVQEKGLEFNLNEPWQRSLLREFQAHYDQPRVRNPAQLVMVGHTESRDFALDVGRDDFTLTTDSSSTIPIRSQVVHRPWIYQDDSALFDDEQTATSGEHSKYADQYGVGGDRVSPRSLREERDVGAHYYGTSYYVPPSPQDAGMHARHSLNRSQWLEMEHSRVGDDHDDATTVAVAANQDACFCMGYNVLDLWMPPTTSTGSSKVRRKSRRASSGKRRLGRVVEGSHENSYDRQLQQKFTGRTDPDGAYNDQHYSKFHIKG